MTDPSETFQIECNELLSNMEDALIVLESVPDDISHINVVFRAMHTIKGTAGVFGYDEIVSFTHVIENILDKVRDNDINMTENLVGLLLECIDHTKILVHSGINENKLSEIDETNEKLLLDKLNVFFDNSTVTKGKIESSSHVTDKIENKNIQETAYDDNFSSTKSNPSNIDVINQDQQKTKSEYWYLSIRFDYEIFESGMDPLSFFSYLNKMGTIINVSTMYGKIPLDETFNPEKNYLGFELLYDCIENKEKIEQTFEFVSEMCRLCIIKPHAEISEYAKLIIDLPKDDELVSQMFVDSGALTVNEANILDEILQKYSCQDECQNSVDKSLEKIEYETHRPTSSIYSNDDEELQSVSTKSHLKSAVKPSQILRVDAEKLDTLINLVGELVIAEAATNMIASKLGDEQLIESISNVNRLVEDIRDNTLNLRMVPVGDSFNRFKRVVRDISHELGKEIKLVIEGADTELDKTVVEKISDPLMHIVRNAMDHGLETTDERKKNGKPSCGILNLSAYHEAGSIVIEVKDDGRGLNKEKILAKAIEKKLIDENDTLTDHDIYQLVFVAGFSTAEAVTNLSGRGVGMDVVKKNIEAIRGTVDIYSTEGEGSKVIIRLPLTLAIIDGFLVKVGQSSYVIPLDMVYECIDLSDDVNLQYVQEELQVQAQGFITLRGEVLPFIQLRQFFNEDGPESQHKSLVLVKYGDTKAGFIVDELLGELQTVIKPMGKILNNIKGLSGATILGGGEVAIILDVPNLIKRAITSYKGLSNISHNKIHDSIKNSEIVNGIIH